MKKRTFIFCLFALLLILPVILPGVGFAQEGSRPLTILFENNEPIVDIPGGGVATPLFCEGNVECGVVEYTDANFLESNINRIDVFFTVKVCEGESCVTAHNAHFIEDAIPELTGLLPDGVPFAATLTDPDYDPIDCNETTGKFKSLCETSGLKLDYRCEAIVQFDDQGNFVKVSRSLSGSYTISRVD